MRRGLSDSIIVGSLHCPSPFLLRIVIISRAVLQYRHLGANKETGSCRAIDYFIARVCKTVCVSNVSPRRLSAAHRGSCSTWPLHMTLIKYKLEPALKNLNSYLLSTRILLITAYSLKNEAVLGVYVQQDFQSEISE